MKYKLIPFLFVALLFALVAFALSGAELTIRWSDNSDNEIGFILERSANGTDFIPIEQTGQDQQSVTDAGLLPSTQYWYRVKAFNDFGSSGYSNTASAVTAPEGAAPSAPGAVDLSAPGRLTNLSARAALFEVDGSRPIIGFTVEGEAIVVLLRAIGPTIGNPPYSVPNALDDPILTLTKLDGTPVASNDNWSGQAIVDAAAAVGAFALPAGSGDAALLVNLPAGNYTAILSGAEGATGIALFEIYHVN